MTAPVQLDISVVDGDLTHGLTLHLTHDVPAAIAHAWAAWADTVAIEVWSRWGGWAVDAHILGYSVVPPEVTIRPVGKPRKLGPLVTP